VLIFYVKSNGNSLAQTTSVKGERLLIATVNSYRLSIALFVICNC